MHDTGASASLAAAPQSPALQPPAPPPPDGRLYSGLSASERAQMRRTNLLAAALELFAENGYEATSIEQICQAASVGLKSFYDEFGTKALLLRVLYEELYDRVSFEFFSDIARLEAHDDSSRELMSAWVRATVRDRRAAKVMFIESVGTSAASEAFRQVTRRNMAEQVALAYSRGLYGTPVVEPLPRSIALGLTAGVLELVRDWLLADTAVTVDAHLAVDADLAVDEPATTGETVSVDELTERVVQFCRIVFAGLDAEPR
jgi:AcrR family transcriptional regulator